VGFKKFYTENKELIHIAIAILTLSIVIATILLIQRYRKRLTLKTSTGMKTYIFKDASTGGIIQTLHPLLRVPISDFIEQVESPAMGDLTVTITSGKRTLEQQQQLDEAGTSPVSVSLHNFGLAVDINVNGKDINGKTVALRKASPLKDWQSVINIGNKMGLVNGGTFSNTYDPIHFQYNVGRGATALLADYQAGRVKEGYVIV
jgi:hypothetical protein